MSFVTGLSLLIGLLVLAPIAAHMLRRGRTVEHEFPAARLVPKAVITSNHRRKLEDRSLLSIRSLMVVALAVLGATPFITCSRLTVEREGGASVALAIVLDDSHSMQAMVEGKTRFELATNGIEQLLSSARPGDAFAIILAGTPARIALPPTTQLKTARKFIKTLKVSDRSTDLDTAVQLARTVVKELPHADKRVILLSDLETHELPSGTPPLSTPLPELAKAQPNCGIASAERQGRSIRLHIGCNSAQAAKGRSVELFLATEATSPALTSAPLEEVPGPQSVTLTHDSLGFEVRARLTGEDAINSDNEAAIATETGTEMLAVIADANTASAITGGPTVLEQALSALDPNINLRPLTSIPEATEDLKSYIAVVVDDPPGLSPEARAALTAWVEEGGVCLGLLGPSAASSQLAASLEPFARKGSPWESGSSVELDIESLAWLGSAATSLSALSTKTGGRLRLDGADLPGTTIIGTWTDGVPWLFRRRLGRGLLLTVGLPASVEQSDFALRPGFLALLDTVISEARLRSGAKRGEVGTSWTFPEKIDLKVTGPTGTVVTRKSERDGFSEQVFTATQAGRYDISVSGSSTSRFAVLSIDELTSPPLVPSANNTQALGATQSNQVDASPQWAVLILLLFALELLIRVYGPKLKAKLQRA